MLFHRAEHICKRLARAPLKLLHRLKLAVFEIRIYKKWREDCRHLPLTAEHWELYGNHDSGTVILVRDKTKLDRGAAREQIDSALSRPYGCENGEWAYSYIEPRVLVEELLDTSSGDAPADYKFHCSEGHVLWLQYIYDRGKNTKEVIVDSEGRIIEEHFSQNMEHSNVWNKPVCWNEMLDCAKKLSADRKYVRVDLFQVGERIVVGELTFFPLMGCYKTQSQIRLGGLLRFDRKSVKRPISLPASA